MRRARWAPRALRLCSERPTQRRHEVRSSHCPRGLSFPFHEVHSWHKLEPSHAPHPKHAAAQQGPSPEVILPPPPSLHNQRGDVPAVDWLDPLSISEVQRLQQEQGGQEVGVSCPVRCCMLLDAAGCVLGWSSLPATGRHRCRCCPSRTLLQCLCAPGWPSLLGCDWHIFAGNQHAAPGPGVRESTLAT